MVSARKLRKAQHTLEVSGIPVLDASEVIRKAEERPTPVRDFFKRNAQDLTKTALVFGAVIFIFASQPRIPTDPNQYQIAPFRQKLPLNSFSAVGISSEGSSRDCGVPIADCNTETRTGEIVGYAKVSSMHVSKVLTSDRKDYLVGYHTAGITLSTSLDIQTGNYYSSDIKDNMFIVQESMVINTAKSTATFHTQIAPGKVYSLDDNDNMITANPPKLTNNMLSGSGTVDSSVQVYIYNPSKTVKYKRSFDVYLVLKSGDIGGQPIVQFGYAFDSKKSMQNTPVIFDAVRFKGVTAQTEGNSPNFYMSNNSGDQQIPGFRPQTSADLMLSAPFEGDISIFTRTSVPKMGIYARGYDGSFYPLDIVSPQSQTIGEGEYNIKVQTSANGYVSASTGIQKGDPQVSDIMPLAPLLRNSSTSSNF